MNRPFGGVGRWGDGLQKSKWSTDTPGQAPDHSITKSPNAFVLTAGCGLHSGQSKANRTEMAKNFKAAIDFHVKIVYFHVKINPSASGLRPRGSHGSHLMRENRH